MRRLAEESFNDSFAFLARGEDPEIAVRNAQAWVTVSPGVRSEVSPETPGADAHCVSVVVRVLGVKLGDNPGWRRRDADPARSRGIGGDARRGVSVSVETSRTRLSPNVGSGTNSPDIGALTVLHFRAAGGRPKLGEERVHILPDELLAEPTRHLLTGRRAAAQRKA